MRLRFEIEEALDEGYSYIGFNTTKDTLHKFIEFMDNYGLWYKSTGYSKEALLDKKNSFYLAIDLKDTKEKEYKKIIVRTGSHIKESDGYLKLLELHELIGGNFRV